MPGDDATLLNVDSKENVAPNQIQRLSRFPHPYHRNRANVFQDNGTAAAPAQSAFITPTPNSYHPDPGNGATYFERWSP